jgi:hypothetical protein
VDDSVDPAVAAAGTAGSVAAQQDTVVRDKVDASTDTDSQATNSGSDNSGSGDLSESLDSSVFDSSKEPVTVSRTSPIRSSSKASASGSTPPPASAASLAASSRPTSPRFIPADTTRAAKKESNGSGEPAGVAEASADPNSPVKAVLPIPKSGKFGVAEDAPPSHDDNSGRAISPSGNAAPPPPVNEPDSKQSSAATLAAAALAGDPVTPGYSPAGYSDYSPPGYSSRDSVWPTAPSPSRDARPATSGFPPASGESSRLAAGYVPVEPAAPASSSRSSSSIWTSQEPTSGKIGYSPSGGQRPDGIGLGTTAAPGATAASVAAGAAAAGIAASSQLPGRMVASKPPVPTSAPPQTDDLVSKLKAPFSTVTKKRKPAQPSRPINSANAGLATAGIAAAVKTKPAPTKRPAASVSPQAARQPGAESHRDAQLVVSRIEPWSVMKFSFITALAGWIVLFVAVALLYYALRAFGVFHYLEQSVATVTSSKGHAGEDASSWLSASTVLGYTMLVGAINVVMLTALATVGAVIYNLVTHVAGGVEVTLREAD